LAPHKARLLKCVRSSGAAGAPPRALEVSVGPGGAFPFSAADCAEVLALDASPSMFARARAAAAALGLKEGQMRVEAGDFSALPLPDGAVDVVLCMFVLCSVPDPVAAGAETRRVLRPGGLFLFMVRPVVEVIDADRSAALSLTLDPPSTQEHVAADPAASPWLAHAQRLARPVWAALFQGCQITRDAAAAVRAAGFACVDAARSEAPISIWALPVLGLVQPMVSGVAVASSNQAVASSNVLHKCGGSMAGQPKAIAVRLTLRAAYQRIAPAAAHNRAPKTRSRSASRVLRVHRHPPLAAAAAAAHRSRPAMTANGLDSPKGAARGPAAWLACRPPLQLAALAFTAALACAWGGAGWARAHAPPPPRPPLFGAAGSAAAAPAAARCPNGLEAWPLHLAAAERRVYSQTMQDGVLEEIFSRLGTTNKQFVEFGFDSDAYESGGGGANTRLLHAKGWRGLLLDGGHANPAINLHKATLSPENIVDLFAEHGVPDEPDYISIDLDSCDIWLFLALAKRYRPRVVTIEYNSNFPAGSTLAWPPDCSLGWEPFKAGGHPRVMGSALGAVYLAAADAGYVVVHAVKVTVSGAAP
jgi:SAM-dependent methyltransferase